MASAIYCFKKYKNQFTPEEKIALRSESRRLAIKKKIGPKEAMVQVVRTLRNEAQAEYDKISDVVREHVKVPVKVPVKVVKAEKKVVKAEKKVPEKKAEPREKIGMAKQPWQTSDLANRPNIPASYVQAKKQANGKYKLFFTGTTSEVFEGETFTTAPEARSFFKVQQAKAQAAATTAEKKDIDVFADMWDSQIDSRTKNALINRGGWVTRLGKTSAEGKEIIKSKWNKVPDDAKVKLKNLMKNWVPEQAKIIAAEKKEEPAKEVEPARGVFEHEAKFSEQPTGAPGPVYVRLGSLTDEVLSKMNRYLKSLGYDVRGKEDIHQHLVGRSLGDGKYAKGKMNKDREIHHPDWADAYERAWKGAEVRKKKLKIKKEKKVSAANVDWDRIRELGKTTDIREAGYITPEGGLIDLSGKREGGEPGTRSYDHREAGGTLGMQEFMALGNIRMDSNTGMVDILVEPTPAQYKKIDELVRAHRGELVIDLGDGLGEQRDTYYLDPDRTSGNEYQKGTTLSEIKNDIERFYAGEKVKLATRPVLFSRVPDMYSALTRAAESPKFPAKLPAKSVINQLKRGAGVKQVEIDVSSLAEWLEGKDRVTKAEVVDFLRMNEIRVEEIEKGEALTHKRLGWMKRGNIYKPSSEFNIGKIEYLPSNGKYIYEGLGGTRDIYDTLDGAKDAALRAAKNIGIRDTKFAEYVLPGGEPGTYRELVLRVPKASVPSHFFDWLDMSRIDFFALPEEKRIKISKKYETEKSKIYKSAHWDEPNVIAHMRGDTRIVDGKRIFHIVEFQSDIYSRIVELEAERAGKIILATDKPGPSAKELANLKRLFPWGENWHELVAKKALEYAVKNDFDGISWDTAKTQVDRWESALRKSVDKIGWSKRGEKVKISGEKDGHYVFDENILLQGETIINGQKVTLNNLIGKELANKIRESSENSGKFEGKDLTLGGEFYKIIYDQKIPGFLKKYGKKWGTKVGKGEVVAGEKPKVDRFHLVDSEGNIVRKVQTEFQAEDIASEENLTVIDTGADIIKTKDAHILNITPAMKDAIQTAGQPLFAEGKAQGKNLTVDTAKAEIAKRIGQKAVDALERTKKVIFITKEEQTDIIGYARASKDQGFFKDGTVYLIPENINEGKAWGVLMHELGVHLGYNKIFGEKLAKEVFAAFVANNGKMTPLGKAVSQAMRRVPYGTRADLINEEAVAYFTEEHANIDLPLHRKIIARMRLWAVKYFGVKPDVFVMDDYVALAASAMRGEIKEAYKAPVEGSREVFYSTAEKKDLQSWADDLIKSAKDGGEIIRKTEPIAANEYLANRKTNRNIKLAATSNMKRVASEIVEGIDKYLGSISTRLGQVSPKLKAKMRRLDFNINTKYNADVKAVKPLLIKAKKMSKEDFADWDYARKNSDIAKINELVTKYDMQKEYLAYREVLGRLRLEGIDAGLDIGEIEEYAPRILKDTEGFLVAIGKDPGWPLYSRQLQERANELGITVAKMPNDIKADIISNTILGGWSGLSGVPATKQRKLEKIPPELNQYYMDSDAALMQHLHSMRKGIETRKFFGKIPKKVAKMRTRLYAAQSKIREMNELLKAKPTEEEAAKLKRRRNKYIGLEKAYTAHIAKYATQRDYTENVGAYVLELIEAKEISPHHERIVNEILNARFHEAGTRGLIQAYKNLSYIDTMGSPISALTQIGDLAWAAYEGGLVRLLGYASKAAIGKAKITRADVGVDRIAQEFADSGALGMAVTKVFKIVGLEKIDAIGKESLMMAALEKYQRQAKKNPNALRKELKPIFEFETDSVIEDLLNDETSENVKLLVYSRLLDFQPVGLSEMPQKYLDAGNGRLFYMLKTFTLKVFDVFRNEAYYKIKNGDRKEKIQGMKNLIMLCMLFVLANAGADELKDWVLGRKTDFSDRMIDNLLRLVGVSKFVTWKARTEGVGSALARQVLPPFKFIDSLGKDIITTGDEKGLEVLGSVPVVGKLAYWHLGRGVSKREDLWNRRLRKRKAHLNKIEEGFEKAKDKGDYRRKHWEELKELQAVKSLQAGLNRSRININKIKGEEETPGRKRTIQRLEKERTEKIRKFLKKADKTDGVVDSIWSGVLGTTAEMNATQAEINRLVGADVLSQSKKPSRSINFGRGRKVKLDDEQYNRYIADTSAIIKKAVDRLMSQARWQGWSDKKKAFAVKRVQERGREIVRNRLKITILKARLEEKRYGHEK